MNTHNPQAEARLMEALGQIRPEELSGFLNAHREELLTEPRPFAAYMRETFRKKGVLQQNVFLAAIRHHIRDVHQVNAIMQSCGLPPLTNERE